MVMVFGFRCSCSRCLVVLYVHFLIFLNLQLIEVFDDHDWMLSFRTVDIELPYKNDLQNPCFNDSTNNSIQLMLCPSFFFFGNRHNKARLFMIVIYYIK